MTADRRAILVLLLVSGTIISLCMGLRQSLGLFMRPVTLDLGVSVGTFGFALALQNMVWGLSQPFVGAIADRYGARPVVIVTALSYVAGLLLLANSRSALGLDLSGLLAGIGIAGTSFGVLIGVVARATPPEKRSQTVGLIAAAGSLGTVVLAPVGQSLLDAFGWRPALMAYAAIAGVMVLLAFAIREPKHHVDPNAAMVPQRLGEALVEAARHKGFIAMTIAYFACGFQLIFITTHLPQYLELCGVSPAVGAQALALIGLFNTFGTWMFGQLGARYSQKKLLALIYLFRTLFIAAFVTLPVTAGSTLVFAAAMGFLWLGVAPLVTVLIGRVLGLRHFNTLYGIVFLSHQVGSFCGAWLGGVSFDLTGAYNVGWASLMFIGALAFTLQWTMDDRPPSQRHRQPDPLPAAA